MKAGKRYRLSLVLAGFALLLCACRVELYSGLDEKEANQILAVLLKNGIDGEKVPGKENAWGLRVEKGDLARAVELLQAGGFPRDRFSSMGEIFRKQGLVSSPMQERILYLYALSQEISETLSHIDGVLTARVHVVIPENNPLKDTLRPSSASVFIRHREDADLEAGIPAIKKLVVNSIEGLTYDNVTVVLFPSETPAPAAGTAGYGGAPSPGPVPRADGGFRLHAGGLGLLLLAALGGAGFFIRLRRRKAAAAGGDGTGRDGASGQGGERTWQTPF